MAGIWEKVGGAMVAAGSPDLYAEMQKQKMQKQLEDEKLAYEKWKFAQENDPNILAEKAKANMLGYIAANKMFQGQGGDLELQGVNIGKNTSFHLGQPKASTAISIPKDLKPLPSTATETQKDAWLSQLEPSQAEIVKGYADYTLDPSKSTSMRSNERAKYIGLAKMYDPNFNMQKYPANAAYVKDVYSGKVANNIQSLNTLVGHLDSLNTSLDSLKADKQPLKNAIILTARNLTGDPSITDYKMAKQVVQSELEQALTGVGVTQEGRKSYEKILNGNAFGYDQGKQFVKTVGHILDTRLKTHEQGYKQKLGRDAGELMRYPDTKKALENIFSGDATQFTINGQVYNIPTDKVESFKKAKGLK